MMHAGVAGEHGEGQGPEADQAQAARGAMIFPVDGSFLCMYHFDRAWMVLTNTLM